jgi:hypothetical protein
MFLSGDGEGKNREWSDWTDYCCMEMDWIEDGERDSKAERGGVERAKRITFQDTTLIQGLFQAHFWLQ